MSLPKTAVFAGLADGEVQLMHGKRIFGADVDDAVGRAGDVGADRHALDQGVRIALDLVAVHVGAGIALVGVADQELPLGLGLAQELPLHAGGVAGAAAPAQAGFLDLLVGRLGRAVDQHLVQGLVAADGDVFLDVVGIDQPGVAQDDLLLAAEEGHLVPQRDVREAGAVVDLRSEMVPFLDPAQSQVGGDGLGRQVVEDSFDVVDLHAVQDDQRLARQANVDQRLFGAEAEAAGAHQIDVQAALVDGLGEGVHHRLGAVARPAGAHADGDARPGRQQLGEAGAVHGVEAGEIADRGHDSRPPLSSASSSLSSERSFMCPKMV